MYQTKFKMSSLPATFDLAVVEAFLKPTLSVDNFKKCMKVIRRLVYGHGVKHASRTDVFMGGTPLLPSHDLEAIRLRANKWLPYTRKTGRVDKSGGWTLNHPIAKLKRFKDNVLLVGIAHPPPPVIPQLPPPVVPQQLPPQLPPPVVPQQLPPQLPPVVPQQLPPQRHPPVVPQQPPPVVPQPTASEPHVWGHIYCFRTVGNATIYKAGMTTRFDVKDRLNEYDGANKVDVVVSCIFVEDARRAEVQMLQSLKTCGVLVLDKKTLGNEWFRATGDDTVHRHIVISGIMANSAVNRKRSLG
jgi:hypothetical protein